MYVVTATEVRVFEPPSNPVKIPELQDGNAIYIFDAKAQSQREPCSCAAFLIETSSRNRRSYEQTERRGGVWKYCIPSYTVEELISIRAHFNVTEEEVRRRCVLIGPSIRYVLVQDFNTALKNVDAAVKCVNRDEIGNYMEDTRVGGDASSVSACLLKLLVHEEDYPNPNMAYRDDLVDWRFASVHIGSEILKNGRTKAKTFVKNFVMHALEVDKLRGVAGLYLELITAEFIARGRYKYRQLSIGKKRKVNDVGDIMLERDQKWKVVTSDVYKIEDALANCEQAGTLYQICDRFPAVDLVAEDFKMLFQVTVSKSHTIHYDTIAQICDYVKGKYPQEKVQLFFVVPSSVYSEWKNCQSFTLEEEEIKNGKSVIKKVQRSVSNLSPDKRAQLSNLEQYVLCYE